MLGPISAMINKIQGKTYHLDKITGSQTSPNDELAAVQNGPRSIEESADTDDVTKKSGQGNYYQNQRDPHQEAEKDSGEIIGDAIQNSVHRLEPPEKKKKKGKKNQQEKPMGNIIDGETATRMDKIFRKTNELIDKLKGSKQYSKKNQKIKTNPDPKGNLLDKKTG